MELVILGLVVLTIFLASGGWSYVRDFVAAVRRFLAEHAVAYKIAGAVSFLCGAALALDVYLHDTPEYRRRYGDDRLAMYLMTLVGVPLVLLPIWFAVVIGLAFLYRNFLAPIVEFVWLILRGIFAVFGFLLSPFRQFRASGESARAAAAREQSAAQNRSARQRREAARSRCKIFFTLHAPEIGSRFTRAMYDDYARRFLGDDRPPEDVEERAAQLEAVLLQHLEKVQPAPKFRGLEDIARWFEEQKRQIDALPDDRMRQTLLATLKARYAELTTRFLEEMQA